MIEGNFDSVDQGLSYGTIEMAAATQQLIGGRNSGLFVMKGHDDGIISYGSNAEEAGKNLLDLYRKLSERQ
jgi:hypothetical protein